MHLIIFTLIWLSFLNLSFIIILLERNFFIIIAFVNLITTFIASSNRIISIGLITLFLLVYPVCDCRFLMSLPFRFICYVEQMLVFNLISCFGF